MHPVLISFGPELPLTTYGVFIATAFLVGIWLLSRQAYREGRSPDLMIDLGFWILVSALVGSRVLFIIVNGADYWNACFHPATPAARDCWLVLKFWQGGLVFYGGFIGAFLASVVYVRRHKIPFLPIADIAIPYVPLGHFFGRLGCFSVGCCYGKLVHGTWGARFPQGSNAYGELYGSLVHPGDLRTPPLHPTQIYEAFGELMIFLLLLFLRQRKRFHGQTVLTYVVLYPLLRTTVEMFRGDALRGYVARLSTPGLARVLGLDPAEAVFLSTSQFVSLLIAVATAVTVFVLRRRALAATPAPPAPAGAPA